MIKISLLAGLGAVQAVCIVCLILIHGIKGLLRLNPAFVRQAIQAITHTIIVVAIIQTIVWITIEF